MSFGGARRACDPYALPAFRPGLSGRSFLLPRENGAACRLPDRRASPSASRSLAFSRRRSAFSRSSCSTRPRNCLSSRQSSSMPPLTPLTAPITTQSRENVKLVNRYQNSNEAAPQTDELYERLVRPRPSGGGHEVPADII